MGLKEKLSRMLEEKKIKRSKLLEAIAAADDAQVRASQIELLGALDGEISDLTEMIERAEEPAAGDEPGEEPPQSRAGELDTELQRRAQDAPVGGLTTIEQRGIDPDDKIYEQRGADLRAGKAVKISARGVTLSSKLVNEKKYSRDLHDHFNEVSGLIDRVNAVPLDGGESYTKGFAVSGGEGDYTAEGSAYHDIDMALDYIDIAKTKITAYAEMTEEVKKLPNINYASYIEKEIRNAIRKKITKQIVSGAGTTGTIVGIYNAPAKVIPADYDLEIEGIDANTLNDIVFHYGGDEDVEDSAVLILSKQDIKAFVDVRNANLEPVYKVTAKGNGGTIEYVKGGVTVEYMINSACKPLSAAGTADGTATMIYGALDTYEMPVFSDVEITESKDYKFKEGMIAFKASVFLGGNVAAYKTFFRVKKKVA